MKTLTIHATNVTGLGACQVVLSFLEALDQIDSDYDQIICYVPSGGPVSSFKPESSNIDVIKHKRIAPRALSRFVECLFSRFIFDLAGHLIVLGDVPLRSKAPQLVLVHQAHLLSPKVNAHVGSGLSFKMMRVLTRLNSSFVKHVIVQTDAMNFGLSQSYAAWSGAGRILTMGQPVPSWFSLLSGRSHDRVKGSKLRLFYPAASYPHKNHKILNELDPRRLGNEVDKIVLTIDENELFSFAELFDCVGRLNAEQCLEQYLHADALLFPSLLESYGLPLVEAMTTGLPIIVADLPYAQVLCGEEAIYFDPTSSASLVAAIQELHAKLSSGWRPNWKPQLELLPHDWAEVVRFFLRKF